MRPLVVASLLLIGIAAAACDPIAAIRLDNTTANPVIARFHDDDPHAYHVSHQYEISPHGTARFPGGYLMERTHLVVVSGRCAHTYPLLGNEAVERAVGFDTHMALGADFRLYLTSRWSPVQPTGWPLPPMRKDCR